MDLGGYVQIESLEPILKLNNIKIPRLRGLRLMENESPVDTATLDDWATNGGLERCVSACRSQFIMNACWATYSARTDAIVEKYIEFERNAGGVDHLSPAAIRWDKVHGRKRKVFKYIIKQTRKDVYTQFNMWNKYCGQKDVMYIHCRLGSGNWSSYDCDTIIKAQPWFLDCVEDAYDHTYLDVYAKIRRVML